MTTMKGAIYIIRPEMTSLDQVERRDLTSSPSLSQLQELCGGYIAPVPRLHSCRPLSHNADPCQAFCIEDGLQHDLPPNPVATRLWRGIAPQYTQILVGNVLVLTGNPAFMKSL